MQGLRVIARTSSFSFKGKSDDIPTIASKLQVSHVLEGSVRKAGNRLPVTTTSFSSVGSSLLVSGSTT
jgi:TolB-like protein